MILKHEPKTYVGAMISSTFADIPKHRAVAIRLVEERGLFARAMEYDLAKPAGDVIELSLEMVRDSAAYIGVISQRYGQPPRCPRRNPDGLSLTELEFNEAQRLKRPTLLFIMGDRHPGTKADFEQSGRKLRKLNAFRERAKIAPNSTTPRVYAVFEDLDDFKDKAANAISTLAAYLEKAKHGDVGDQHQESSGKGIWSPCRAAREPHALLRQGPTIQAGSQAAQADHPAGTGAEAFWEGA